MVIHIENEIVHMHSFQTRKMSQHSGDNHSYTLLA